MNVLPYPASPPAYLNSPAVQHALIAMKDYWGPAFTQKLAALLRLITWLKLFPSGNYAASQVMETRGSAVVLDLSYRIPIGFLYTLAEASGLERDDSGTFGEILEAVVAAFGHEACGYTADQNLRSWTLDDPALKLHIETEYVVGLP